MSLHHFKGPVTNDKTAVFIKKDGISKSSNLVKSIREAADDDAKWTAVKTWAGADDGSVIRLPAAITEMPDFVAPPNRLNGSSPRVRGTPDDVAAGRRRHRFIPACAGNSCMASLSALLMAVHPRVCGELFGESDYVVDDDGSSPRVRGTLGGILSNQQQRRFIPACAGNSSS